jgi:hypothetical protein
VFALDLLGVTLARLVRFRGDMTRVCAPIVRVVPRDAKRLEQRFELQKRLILATTKEVGQDLTTVMIHGMPQPSLIFFALDKRPHLIGFGFISESHDHFHLFWV